MKLLTLITPLLTAGVLSLGQLAQAAVTGYTANPTTNSTDWASAVTGFGGTINSDVNFDTHPVGALDGSFYSVSDGVTLSTTGDSDTVIFGAGPAQGNTTSGPLSPGEGPHAASNYLFDGAAASTLTISFATPVYGAGLFIIDHFDPNFGNTMTIEAFSGANGTGSLLGSFNSVAFNFQTNNRYFMGVASSAGDIGSIVFNNLNSASSGDTVGLDDILFSVSGLSSVPEPASVLFGFAMLAAGGLRRYRTANAQV